MLNKIEKIKGALQCPDLLTKSKGGLYVCPFCGSGAKDHKTGALKYYPETQKVYCHACHTSGDVIDVYAVVNNISNDTAISLLAKRYEFTDDTDDLPINKPAETRYNAPERATSNSMPIKDKISTDTAKSPQKAVQEQINDIDAYIKACQNRLDAPQAISYLSARGISYQTAAAAGIGFDPAADPAESGYTAPRLIIPARYYDRISYTGRATDSANEYRYINGFGNMGISFLSAIYAESDSSDRIIYVTEGAFDALSLQEVGKAAIAINGNQNTHKLLNELQNKPAATDTEFIISFDNDTNPKTAEHTNQAAADLASELNNMGYNAICYKLTGAHKDINELLTADKEELIRLLSQAENRLHPDLDDFMQRIQTDAYKPYATELSFFDDLLCGGVIQQSLIILMAAPGTGKTTLCQQIAVEMAAHQKKVAYLNFEMSREQLYAKSLSYRLIKEEPPKAYSTLRVLQGYKWNQDDLKTISAAVMAYKHDIDPYLTYNPDTAGTTIESIEKYLTGIGEKAKAYKQQAPAIVIDYIHLIGTDSKLENQELLKRVVTVLKGYAVKYNTFVIAISATNRLSNSTGKIRLESGRDSSNLEYTGDYVLALNHYELETDKKAKLEELLAKPWRRMTLRVLKGRFSTPGKAAYIYFRPAYNIFYGQHDKLPVDPDRESFPDENDCYGWDDFPGDSNQPTLLRV